MVVLLIFGYYFISTTALKSDRGLIEVKGWAEMVIKANCAIINLRISPDISEKAYKEGIAGDFMKK